MSSIVNTHIPTTQMPGTPLELEIEEGVLEVLKSCERFVEIVKNICTSAISVCEFVEEAAKFVPGSLGVSLNTGAKLVKSAVKIVENNVEKVVNVVVSGVKYIWERCKSILNFISSLVRF